MERNGKPLGSAVTVWEGVGADNEVVGVEVISLNVIVANWVIVAGAGVMVWVADGVT